MKEIINGHEIEIKSELSPQIIEFLIDSHKSIFDKEFHFNPIFFEMVGKTITEFGKDFNPEKDFTLIAYVDGEKMGSISGIGRENGNVQLRFYFLHEGARGMKLGKKLFVAAMDKCKEMGYNHIFFHTFYRKYNYFVIHLKQLMMDRMLICTSQNSFRIAQSFSF
ncbi:MAG: GNAT family N-acetyltransferase [Clostridia bacterium]|nr:GNAT family N-acetyltransferase [Clostridia bacterium]